MGQSAEFGQFLRVMRARMRPEALRLPTTSTSRRVPGLRREEIAQLAGVSTDYYTRMEQGRRTDVLSSNRLTNLLFTDFSDLPVRERNLSRWIILEPGARELFRDWETVAAETVAALRVDVGRHPNDPLANQPPRPGPPPTMPCGC